MRSYQLTLHCITLSLCHVIVTVYLNIYFIILATGHCVSDTKKCLINK